MNNIFENAKFGDKFRTRDGRMAIYQNGDDEFHHLFLSSCDILVDNYGYINCKELPSVLDIVSEWNEPINEEELDELANLYVEELEELGCEFNTQERLIVIDTYKTSYRKAMEI